MIFLRAPVSYTHAHYGKDIGLRRLGASRPCARACRRFTPSSGDGFGYGFLQIPHWPIMKRYSPTRAFHEGFFGRPCLRLYIASFQGLQPDLHRLDHDHAGHTPAGHTRKSKTGSIMLHGSGSWLAMNRVGKHPKTGTMNWSFLRFPSAPPDGWLRSNLEGEDWEEERDAHEGLNK